MAAESTTPNIVTEQHEDVAASNSSGPNASSSTPPPPENSSANVQTYTTDCYKTALGVQSLPNIQKILKMKIIPPFRKEHFKNSALLEREIAKAYSEILQPFPPRHRPLITISRTFEKRNGKSLHMLLVTAPQEAEEDVENIKINGLQILGRTIFPTGEDFYQIRSSQYPRKVWLRITNLPYLCNDSSLTEMLNLPEQIQTLGPLQRETINTEYGQIHSGKARIQVSVPDADSINRLREWSFLKNGHESTKWCDIPIYMSAPTLHHCTACEAEGRLHIGHDIMWCRINRNKKERIDTMPQNTEDDTTPISIDDDSNATNPEDHNDNGTGQPHCQHETSAVTQIEVEEESDKEESELEEEQLVKASNNTSNNKNNSGIKRPNPPSDTSGTPRKNPNKFQILGNSSGDETPNNKENKKQKDTQHTRVQKKKNKKLSIMVRMDKTFDLFFFNVRGLASQKAKLIEICNLTKKLSKNKKYFVLLQETKLEKMKEELNKILKYHNLEYVMTPAYQNSGGLLILFPKKANIEVLGKTRCSLVVFDKESKIVIMNLYINPKDYSLETLKASAEELKLTHDHQIIMASDLNFINPSYMSSNNIKPKSIIKPNDIRILRYKKFVPVKSSLLLIDLALLLQNIGPTHVNKRLGNHSRIDYIFSNITKFSVESHKLDLIPFAYSDHKGPHLYELNHTEIVQPLWKLDNNVLERSESVNDILQQAKTASSKFGNIVSCHDIFQAKVIDCLKTLSVNIKRSKEVEILDIQNGITKLEKLLQNTQNVIHPESREKQWKNLSELEQKLQKIKNIENNKFAKQMKGFFREANEGNPKLIKLLAKNIALDKEIKKIEKQDGSLTEDPNEIIDELFKFYKTLSQPKLEQTENISEAQQK